MYLQILIFIKICYVETPAKLLEGLGRKGGSDGVGDRIVAFTWKCDDNILVVPTWTGEYGKYVGGPLADAAAAAAAAV